MTKSLRKKHREKISPENNKPFNALVARKVGKKEILSEPKARAALEKEWTRLRSIDGGNGCWDEKEVREWSDVVKEANANGKTVHVGSIFEICVEKGSELQRSDPNRKYKGRVVFGGDRVKTQSWEQAIFEELSSCPATMEAAKTCDMYGCLPGH